MKKSRMLGALVAGVAMLVATAGVAAAQGGESLTFGSKDFAGAEVLSQVWGQAFEVDGSDVTFQDNIGPTEVTYPALQNGDIDAYADYQGTLLLYLGGTPTSDTDETYDALTTQLEGTGIVASQPAPAVDVNGFYVLKKTAKKYDLSTVSDLSGVADELTFGGPPECEERDQCLGPLSQQLYGLDFEEVKKLDVGGPITVKALEDGDIQVAILFTGSSVIPKNAVLLEDDQGLQSADNPVLLMREEVAGEDAVALADEVATKITTKAYNRMSLAVTIDKEDAADVASAFLKKNNLD